MTRQTVRAAVEGELKRVKRIKRALKFRSFMLRLRKLRVNIRLVGLKAAYVARRHINRVFRFIDYCSYRISKV